jgi:hypothetical protein
MDFRTGKLSEPDFAAIDGELRAEALEILDALERIEGPGGAAESGEGSGPGAGSGPAQAGEGSSGRPAEAG